jgi:hypothetical protein
MNAKPTPDADDHWRRLAAELGLEVEPPAPRADAMRESPEPPPPPPFADPREEFVAAEAPVQWPPAPQEFVAPGLVEEEFLDQAAQASAEEEPVSESPADLDAADDKPRRRRRRSRRKKGETAADPSATAAGDHAQDEDDDPTAEVVKDWNIPSWNELIASLYRPDR